MAFDSIILSFGMPTTVGSSLSGFTVIREVKEREIVADIHVASSDWTQPLIQIAGLRCTEMPSQKAELGSLVARPSPTGTVTYRPDIDLFDEDGLMGYINENQKQGSSATDRDALYSERLRNAVAQVRFHSTTFDDLDVSKVSDNFRRSSSLPFSKPLRCRSSR